jgi:putative addiction module component (TIGR02574 family)
MALPALNLNSLSPEEKLRLLEEVWESLATDPAKVPLTDWQRRELDRRLDEVEREGPTGIPWDRVLSEIEGRTR